MGNSPQPSAYESLHPRDQRFVNEYLRTGFNATAAARACGFNYPSEAGYTLLRKPYIDEAIKERLNDLKLSDKEVLARISMKCTADMSHFISISKDGGATLDLRKARRNGVLHHIKKIKTGKRGKIESIELHDPRPYLEMMARHHKLIDPEVAPSDNGETEIVLEWDDVPSAEGGEE